MNFLIDTNVVSELTRRRPQSSVLAWAESVARHTISAISVEELWFGIARKPEMRITEWIAQYLLRHDVLPVTPEIAMRAGRLRGDFSLRGITRSQSDMLIAATAQAHNLTLVTRNIRDFDACGIALLDPFMA